MNTILRNLFYTLKRFRAASLLNLLGLSTAFAAFIVIMMKVSYERNFDTCYPEYERLAFINLEYEGQEKYLWVSPRALVDDILQNTPGIECGSIYALDWKQTTLCTDLRNPNYFYENVVAVYPDFARTLGLTFVQGDAEGMKDPEGAIIPESMAMKLFPQDNAVNSYLYIKDHSEYTEKLNKLKISGVYKDLPENAQFNNSIYTCLDKDIYAGNWNSQNFYSFVRLKKGVSYDDLNKQLAASKGLDNLYTTNDTKVTAYALPIHDIYYSGLKSMLLLKVGNPTHTYLLICIALLVIGIAIVNLINFSTSLTPMRIRSINTQKVLGSSVGSLRLSLILETMGIVCLGWLASLLILFLLTQGAWLEFLEFDTSLIAHKPVIILSLAIALATGVVSGIYPAWYMTSFPPALVLKGNYALSGKGRRLRTVLIGFQYIVSFTLIICTSFIYLQNQFMKNASTGFERNELLKVDLPMTPYDDSQHKAFEHELLSHPEFEGVAYADNPLGTLDIYSTRYEYNKDKEVNFFCIYVSPSFLKVIGTNLEEGRDFTPNDTANHHENLVIATRRIGKEYQIRTDEVLRWYKPTRIIGYMDDVIFTSNRAVTNPYMFYLAKEENKQLPYAYIRVKAGSNPEQVLDIVRKAIEKSFTGYPADVQFFDSIYQQLYKEETHQQQMITLFSLLAIIISLVGIFGLAIFEMEHRKKEIGVRKVYGATTGQILWSFNRLYLKIMTVCFIIAAPIAYYSMSQWLQGFNTRISISPGVFIATFATVCLLTVITISIQTYRAANANPINSIKSE